MAVFLGDFVPLDFFFLLLQYFLPLFADVTDRIFSCDSRNSISISEIECMLESEMEAGNHRIHPCRL